MRRFFYIIILLSVTSICHSAPNEKLIVLLDWFANPNHAPLFIAQQQGYFKEYGLDVALINPADPSTPPKLVAAGKADIAITYQPQFMEQVDQGLPLIRIGTLMDRPLACIAVLKKGTIQSIADLKGKRIGYSSEGVNNVALKIMLEKHHLSLKDVTLIHMHYDLTQALLSQKIDAATGMMRNFELIQMELLLHPARAFFPEQHGMPTYSELILVAHNTKVNESKYLHFLMALQKGITYLQAHPDESWKAFSKNHPELNDDLNQRAWNMTVPYFVKDPATFDKDNWLNLARFMQKEGLIKRIQPITQYAIDLTKIH